METFGQTNVLLSLSQTKPLTLVYASLSRGLVRPHAGAGVLVKVQSVGAGQLNKVSIDAVVELVADSRIGMGKESVASRAVGVSLRRLQFSAVLAINVEGLVAFVHLPDRLIEDEAVGTKFLLNGN